MRGTIKTLLEDDKEITTLSEISFTLQNFYENLFQKTITKSTSDIEMFSSDIHLPTISDENYNICEAGITEDNLLVAQIKVYLIIKLLEMMACPKNFMKLFGKI